MIIPIWQNTGQSSHLLAKQVGAYFSAHTKESEHQKATHTGTLDPMAEGVLIVLTNEDRFKKSEYANSKKVYNFSMLIGVATDSQDLLGLQTQVHNKEVSVSEIKSKLKTILPKFLGTQTQLQPVFSAQRVNGVSAFDKAKNKEIIVPKQNKITIFSINLLDTKRIKIDSLYEYITNKVVLISGDFRQKEVLDNWKLTIDTLEKSQIKTLVIVQLEATVSKRTYIRSLVKDIGAQLQLPVTTQHIIRTQNAGYQREDCKILE